MFARVGGGLGYAMSNKYWWIKERHNPQLGVYYVGCGNISAAEAKAMESPLYGDNYMHKFSTKDEYEKRLKELASK